MIREVRKRDGRVVPFDREKIADAISRAFAAVSPERRESSLFRELSAAVDHFLSESVRSGEADGPFVGGIPSIEDVQDTVENVLMEMGHSSVAKAFILYRQKRSILRDTLEVRRESEAGAPQVEESGSGRTTWQKGRIAAALIREADLDPTVADEVATAVEARVLRSGLRRISTQLLRELVDNELFERGFATKLRRHAPIGLPRYDLEQLIFVDDAKSEFAYPKTPGEVRELIASRIFREYSLGETFSSDVADAHHDGRIFVHGLEDPLRLGRGVWTLPKLELQAGSADAAQAVDAFFLRLRRLQRYVGEEIRLRGLESWIRSIAGAHVADESIRDVLAALVDAGTGSGHVRIRTTLDFDLTCSAEPWLRSLASLDARRLTRLLVCLRLHPDFSTSEGRGLRSCIAALARRGADIELLPECPSEGAASDVWSLVLGKATINLPRAAFRSSRQRGASIEAELDASIDVAIRALQERRQFVRRLASRPEAPLYGLFGADASDLLDLGGADSPHELVIGLVGLNECVQFLTGRELHQDRSAQARARELLERISARIERDRESLGLRLVVEETANRGALRRFEEIDARLYRPEGRKDLSGEGGDSWTYTDGVRWHRHAPIDPLKRLQELVSFAPRVRLVDGVVDDMPELGSSDGDLLVSLLDESLPWLSGSSKAGTAAEV